MMELYILDEHNNPVLCDDLIKFGQFMEKSERRVVSKTQIGEYVVSTVFLGVDHGYHGDKVPVLFETAIFGQDETIIVRRYCSWKQAEKGHLHTCKYVDEANDLKNEGLMAFIVAQ
jgi:hypothetical protein